MKKFHNCLAWIFLLLISSCGEDNQESDLWIMKEHYPRAFFFRGYAEHIGSTSYQEWSDNFGRLMGIEGKALDEEIPGRSLRNLDYFSRFKQDHPEQLILLHFNGNSRDPRFESHDFFAGHWLYYNGAKIVSDVVADTGVCEIEVSDASLFRINIGRNQNSREDIGLCELNTKGQPDWSKSEQVELIDVDTLNNRIRIRRACFGTEARAFPAGKSYAASHVVDGPWGGNIMWFYNFSTRSPKDQNGNQCADILAADLARRFKPGAKLAYFDGIQFDVMFAQLRTHLFIPESYRPGSKRAPDTDADGNADDGVFQGINTYSEGMVLFLKNLRKQMDVSKLVLADANSPTQQRAFNILNGTESEGWPYAYDVEFNNWSWGINRLLYWQQNSSAPKLNYINLKWAPHIREKAEIPSSAYRMVIAVSCLTDNGLAMHARPGNDPKNLEIWDELVMGQEKIPGWLGRPVGPLIRIARKSQNLIGEESLEEIRRRINAVDESVSDIRLEGGEIKIIGNEEITESMRFVVSGLPVMRGELTVFLEVMDASVESHKGVGERLIQVIPGKPGIVEKNNRYLSWIGKDSFESVFYYPDNEMEVIDLFVNIERNSPVLLKRIEIYNHPDAMCREFENGCVLVNPSSDTFRFDMEALFPVQHFRRLKGTQAQDTITNNGSEIHRFIDLQGKDALFLVRK